MYISCPSCETTFSLPDELYKPGKKARCSQCGTVFPMSAEAAPDPGPAIGETAAPVLKRLPRPQKKYMPAFMALAAAILLVMLGYGGYLMYSAVTAPPENVAETDPASPGGSSEQEQLINQISLDEIRQFLVDNVHTGKIMVIQGLAVNKSDGRRDLIAIEARVMDANNRVLAAVRQVCGVPLTLFQLQSLTEKEIKESLDNRITILTNNSDVPPGGKVPFVVVFPNPPENMRTFEVRVIDARVSPNQ
jgi:predicted Zn finger-like uncharacterized protein